MTIRDIAKLANVSKSTISRVINNDSNVKEETRQRVLEIIKKYDFTPNTNAKKLSTNNTRTISLIVPDILNTFFSIIVHNIIKLSKENNYTVILSNSLEDYDYEKELVNQMITEKVSKIILIPTTKTYFNLKKDLKYYNKLKEVSDKNNLIIVDRQINDEFKGVFIDNFKLGYLAAKNIFNKTEKNCIITGPLNELNALKRFQGFKKYIEEKNAELIYFEGNFDIKSGCEAYNFIKKNNIKNIFVSNNLMTLGIYKSMKVEEIKKYNIFSFEEIENSKFLKVDIPSFNIPYEKIAKKAFEMAVSKNKNLKSQYLV